MENEEKAEWVVAKEPWFVKDVMSRDDEVNYYIDLDHNSEMFRCNTCNKISPIVESTYFLWRSFTKHGHVCYVYVKIPKVRCQKHGVHDVDKNKFRRMGGFIEFNYSETIRTKSFNNRQAEEIKV